MSRRPRVPVASQASRPATSNLASFLQAADRGLADTRRELDEEGDSLRNLRGQLRHLSRTGSMPALGRPRARPGGLSTRATRSTAPSTAATPTSRLRTREDVAGGASQYLKEWERHDTAWASFQAEPPDRVVVGNVPWPPCSCDILEFCERLWAPGHPKQAYRIACRRWHPDKFLHIYGSRVPPEDLEGLTSQLNQVFQEVTSQWQRKMKPVGA